MAKKRKTVRDEMAELRKMIEDLRRVVDSLGPKVSPFDPYKKREEREVRPVFPPAMPEPYRPPYRPWDPWDVTCKKVWFSFNGPLGKWQ